MQLNSKAQQRRKLFVMMVLFVLAMVVVGPAAAQGIEKVNTTMNMFVTALKTIGIGVATISLLWGGYKMQFQGASFAELAPKFGGMMIAGSAAAIAGFVMA